MRIVTEVPRIGRLPFYYVGKDVKNVVKINGCELDIAGKTLAEYLASTAYDRERIAVERNGEIIPKAMYGETVLEDGDCVEIVRFVGGG